MFKIFLLCILIVTISGIPTQDQRVDTVPVAIKNEPLPQAFPVPVEHVLKASRPQTNNEEVVDQVPLKDQNSQTQNVASITQTKNEDVIEQAQNNPVVENQNSQVSLNDAANADLEDKNRIFLLLASKFTTTTTSSTTTTSAASATTTTTTTTTTMMM